MADVMIEKEYEFWGCGFPVLLINAPFIKMEGEWALAVNMEKLQRGLLKAVAKKPYPLTGAEIRFIRIYFNMTLSDFAKMMGMSHVAVGKWENTGQEPAKIKKVNEMFLRLMVLEKLEAADIEYKNVYLQTSRSLTAKNMPTKAYIPLKMAVSKRLRTFN